MATHLTAFITSADLTTFLGAEKEKLTANGMTAAKFARVIAEINSEIDGYVQYRELEFTPEALKNHACVVAVDFHANLTHHFHLDLTHPGS